jgi:hypothetical protein
VSHRYVQSTGPWLHCLESGNLGEGVYFQQLPRMWVLAQGATGAAPQGPYAIVGRDEVDSFDGAYVGGTPALMQRFGAMAAGGTTVVIAPQDSGSRRSTHWLLTGPLGS